MQTLSKQKNHFSVTVQEKDARSVTKQTFFFVFMQRGNNIQFFICFSFVFVLTRVCFCVCVSANSDSLSDGKLRVHCTKAKHRSTEAQAGVEPIDNHVHFVVFSFSLRGDVFPRRRLSSWRFVTKRQRGRSAVNVFYADRLYDNAELQGCFCK